MTGYNGFFASAQKGKDWSNLAGGEEGTFFRKGAGILGSVGALDKKKDRRKAKGPMLLAARLISGDKNVVQARASAGFLGIIWATHLDATTTHGSPVDTA